MTQELKPCKHCNHADPYEHSAHPPYNTKSQWQIQCGNKGCRRQTIYYDSLQEAIKAWNQRHEGDQ